MKAFFEAITSFFGAIKYLFKYNMWWMLIIPLILSIFISSSIYFIADVSGNFIDQKIQLLFSEWLTPDNYILSYLNRFASFFIRISLKLSLFLLLFMYGKYLILILLSPILSIASSIFANRHFEANDTISFSVLIKQIVRSVIVIVRNMIVHSLIIALVFLICYLFPPAILVQPIVLLILSAYFYGFTFIDYVLERKMISPKNADKFVFKNAGSALGIGICFSMLFKIPFIGIIFAPLMGVIAATKNLELKANQYKNLNP
jgi:CysZ protein